MTSNTLAGSTALITGASRGIGRAVAIEMARLGVNVIINYRAEREMAEEVQKQCKDYGVIAEIVKADVSTPTGVAMLYERSASVGPVSILVNNAGQSLTKLLTETTMDEWSHVISNNLTSAYLCMRSFLPDMIQRRHGRIINLSSIWGMVGGSCESAYSAAKGGIIALTKAAAKEVANSGVTVNAVAPGAVDTDMTSDLKTDDMKVIKAEIPVGRLGTVKEVASLVTYLASPDASYVTGQVISPNGGWYT